MSAWANCKKILCIRADNMGDVLMSSPAIRALKQSFGCTITLLTSSMGAGIASFIPEIDEVITYNLPWVKTSQPFDADSFFDIIQKLKSHHFDAAVIFTVFSQNPLPAAMLAYLADIPLRLAYCRENPYELLTHWVPDKEPYSYIRHQVTRDLELVEQVGAKTANDKLSLKLPPDAWYRASQKLRLNQNMRWLVLHAPVSEQKRMYPVESWVAAGRQLIKEFDCKLLLTGTAAEKSCTEALQQLIGHNAVSIAGQLSLDEFIALIMYSPLLVSVNTGSIHIAAAVNTPVVVLYALTNPQHTPWKVPHKVLYFDVPENLKSKNEVIRHVYDYVMEKPAKDPGPDEIVAAVRQLLYINPAFHYTRRQNPASSANQ
jgi:lipopolysaccharide heptosyltransferase II